MDSSTKVPRFLILKSFSSWDVGLKVDDAAVYDTLTQGTTTKDN